MDGQGKAILRKEALAKINLLIDPEKDTLISYSSGILVKCYIIHGEQGKRRRDTNRGRAAL